MFRTILVVCLLFASSLSLAQPSLSPPDAIETTLLRVEVLNDGHAMPLTTFRGYRRAIGKVDQSYALRLSNLTDERVWVAISIDGINPKTGERAFQGQPGVIIDPGKSSIIDRQKYKIGDGDLVFSSTNENKPGKIALAIFCERMDYPHLLPWNPALEARVGGSVRFDPRIKRTIWLPPSGAAFRKLSTEPYERLYLEYHTVE